MKECWPAKKRLKLPRKKSYSENERKAAAYDTVFCRQDCDVHLWRHDSSRFLLCRRSEKVIRTNALSTQSASQDREILDKEEMKMNCALK